MSKIRVVVADDHAVVRTGLRLLINSQKDMVVVGEAKDAREAVALAAESTPDVVLLDISMPGGNGIRSIAEICRDRPTRVLVLTMHEEPDYLRSSLAAGGSGFLLKRSADSELLSAIRAVASGQRYVDPSIAESLVQELLREPLGGEAAGEERLSPREREVLELLVHGHTNQEISEKIFVSVKTVETYRARLTQKLGIKTRAELVRYAMRQGLLRSDSDAAQ